MSKSLKKEVLQALHEGIVIPAHPLALNASRQLDEERQRLLTRYYIAAGAGGIAVGVHTTQFEIREKKHDLFETVLRLAAEEVTKVKQERIVVKVAGICGDTAQAVKEAELAKKLGYDLGLVSMGGLNHWSEGELLERLRSITEILPVFGFYLQPSVGGRLLSYSFWKQVAELPGVMAIKIAPFNRYETINVARAVCESSRRDEIALYTGNDDNLVLDLLTTYRFSIKGHIIEKQIAGGLLGHWAVWTSKAVELMDEIKRVRRNNESIIAAYPELLIRNVEVTDMNAAIFDPSNGFKGCIPGILEILRRQGLLKGRWCLDRKEELSPGQLEEIDRIIDAYPHLVDNSFVELFLEREKAF